MFNRTADEAVWKEGGKGGPPGAAVPLRPARSSMSMARSSSTELSGWRLLDDSTTNVVTTAENNAA